MGRHGIRFRLLFWFGWARRGTQCAAVWVDLVESSPNSSELGRGANNTQEEIWEAMRHLYDDAVPLVHPLGDIDISSKVTRELGPNGLYMDAMISANNAASLMCSLHFVGGMSVVNVEETYFVGHSGVGDVEARKVIAAYVRHIDEERKEVNYVIDGVQSSTFRHVSERFGCVKLPPLMAQADAVDEGHTQRLHKADEAARLPQESARDVPPPVRNFVDRVASDDSTLSVAVSYKGQLVEHYCRSCGASNTSRFLSYSMSKPLLGLLFSMRQAEGKADFGAAAACPELPAVMKAKRWMSIDNLLNMVVGDPPDEKQLVLSMRIADESANWAALFPTRAPVHPGTWYYSSGHYLIADRELRYTFGTNSTTDAAFSAYPWERLFSKIGAESFVCEKDPDGTILLAGFCFATALDWVKLGRLLLRNGVAPDGSQVLPADFVSRLFGNEGGTGRANNYMYGWYRLDRLYPWATTPILAARGLGGQTFIIVPRHELIIVRHGWRAFLNYDTIFNDGLFGMGALMNLVLALH